MTIITEQRAYAMQGVRFVQRHAFMAVTAIGSSIAAAAADKIQELLGAGRGEEKAAPVRSAYRVGDNVERFCQVWSKYQRVHGLEATRV